MVVQTPRSYAISLAAASSNSVQLQKAGTIKRIYLSMVTAAAGSVEVSSSSVSQIASAAPTSEVIARMRIGATAGMQNAVIPVNIKVNAFDYIYIHTTGAGNVGEITFLMTA